MHTGINTGLVVTGEVDMDRGTHGIAGDTINLEPDPAGWRLFDADGEAIR